MTITEFAKSRGIEPQAVSRYLNRHEELKKQCKKTGKNLVLSAEALEALEQKYPNPKPTVILNGIPEEEHMLALERLTKAQDAIIVLQKQLSDQLLLNAENEAKTMLLEDRQKRAEEEIKELKEKLENEKSKTWWQKIRGK